MIAHETHNRNYGIDQLDFVIATMFHMIFLAGYLKTFLAGYLKTYSTL